MPVTPENSKHGPPRDDYLDGPTAENPGGGGGPGDGVSVPDLAMIWGDAPAITSYTAPQGNGGDGDVEKPPPANSHPAINVSIGSIVEAMQSMLTSSRTAVDGYQQMKQTVGEAIMGGSVFGQHAKYEDLGADDGSTFIDGQGDMHDLPSKAFDDNGPVLKDDLKVQQAAEQYAQAMVPAMTQVLRQCADSIEMAGQFIVLMDRAGTYYSQADQRSIFPEPTGKKWTD